MDYSFVFGIAYGKSIDSDLNHTFNVIFIVWNHNRIKLYYVMIIINIKHIELFSKS